MTAAATACARTPVRPIPKLSLYVASTEPHLVCCCSTCLGRLLLDVGAMGPSVFEIYYAIATGMSSAAEATASPASGALTNLTGAESDYDASSMAAARSLKLVRATRVLKLFRLLKLVKLLRAVKMFNDPDGPFQKIVDKITLAFIAHLRKLAILKLCLIYLVLAHVQVLCYPCTGARLPCPLQVCSALASAFCSLRPPCSLRSPCPDVPALVRFRLHAGVRTRPLLYVCRHARDGLVGSTRLLLP